MRRKYEIEFGRGEKKEGGFLNLIFKIKDAVDKMVNLLKDKNKKVEEDLRKIGNNFVSHPGSFRDLKQAAINSVKTRWFELGSEKERERMNIKNEAIKSEMKLQAERDRLSQLKKAHLEQERIRKEKPWQSERVNIDEDEMRAKYREATTEGQREQNQHTVDEIDSLFDNLINNFRG